MAWFCHQQRNDIPQIPGTTRQKEIAMQSRLYSLINVRNKQDDHEVSDPFKPEVHIIGVGTCLQVQPKAVPA